VFRSTIAVPKPSSAIARPCPLCGNSAVLDLGPIVHEKCATVAGVPLDLDGWSFRLLGCGCCGFRYKAPVVPEERLLACYRAAKADHSDWVVDPHHRRFDMIRTMIVSANPPGRRILDVGCFHGAFLGYLGDTWQRFGVEPSIDAARSAESKGITILAPTLDTLPDSQPFDVITAMDVIEHLNEPMPFFRLMSTHLSPGGLAFLLTGDSEAWQWRLLGSSYWYCSLPEHCSFFSRHSLQFVAEAAGLQLVNYRRTGHSRATIGRKAKDLAKNLSYVAGRALGGCGIPSIRRVLDRRGPGWLTASDHFYAILRKPN
jgi:SAM-dependent methyltransferase